MNRLRFGLQVFGTSLALAVICLSIMLVTGNATTLKAKETVRSGGAKPGCLKLWHKKRVVKYVKRHGRWVKAYRKKVWWTCDPLEALGPPRLSVAAKEYKLTLSRPVVKSGDLTLEYSNRGQDKHNLRIKRLGHKNLIGSVPKTAPRKIATESVPLKPGVYRLYCSLPQHAKLGMTAKLKVVR